MNVSVFKTLDELLPLKERKKVKTLRDLRNFDENVYRTIENKVIEAFNGVPDEDEVQEYLLENWRYLMSLCSSKWIPDEYVMSEEEFESAKDGEY